MFGQRYQTHFWTHPYRDGLKRNVNLDLEAQIHLTYTKFFDTIKCGDASRGGSSSRGQSLFL